MYQRLTYEVILCNKICNCDYFGFMSNLISKISFSNQIKIDVNAKYYHSVKRNCLKFKLNVSTSNNIPLSDQIKIITI